MDSPADLPDKLEEAGKIPGISTCPPEILQTIFKNLDLDTLKACRQVCKTWDRLIHDEPFFLNKICLVHRALGFKPSTQNQIPSTAAATGVKSKSESGSVSGSGSTLAITHLRLQQLYCSKYEVNATLEKLFEWLSSYNTGNITQLEIRASQILLAHFLIILKWFENIQHLSITQDSLIWNPLSSPARASPEIANSDWNLFQGQKLLMQLTKLHISIKRLHEILFLFNDSNMLNAFQNLQELHLQGSLGSDGNLNAGIILSLILRQNYTTLRSLKLDAFTCQVYQRLNSTLHSFDARTRNELFNEFHNFCQMLKNHNEDADTGADDGLPISSLGFPNLEELSLNRFPIANMGDELVQEAFLPFLQQLRSLRKFSMSQLYFSSDACIDQFVANFPAQCQIKLISLHLYVPVLNLDNIVDVLHPNHSILEYENVAAELEFDNVNWKIIFLTWNSLQSGNAFMQSHLSRLVKLKLYNVSFEIGDEEMQFLIDGGEQLVELHFEHCNLQNLTDSGLTGLKSGVCERVRIDKGYGVNAEKDYGGMPLSKLTRLKSLCLGKIGGLVTDASARMGFDRLPSLQQLVIFQHPQLFTADGIEHMVSHRRYYFSYHDYD